MVNSLWCQSLWRRWIAVICENNNGASGERFMWKRCGSFQCLWNHSSVTSRLCPREKKSSMCDRVKLHWSNETNWCPAFPLSLMCFSEFRVISFVKLRRITCVLLWIYICIYLYVCTDLVIGLVVCLFDWYAYEYVGSPSLFVEPMGSFVGGPPFVIFGWARVYKFH